MSNIHIPKELEEALIENKVVLFIGSGFSRSQGLPSWKELIIKIYSNLKSRIPYADSYLDSIEKGIFPLITFLQPLENYKRDVTKIIEQTFNLPKSTNSEIHKKVFEISEQIITTNYDNLLELSINNPYKIVKESIYRTQQLSEKDGFIFKLHGDIEIPENCIFFQSQYEELYNKERKAPIFELEKLITSKTLLFIGFSLSDPYINNVFDSVESLYNGYGKEHFIITTEKTAKFSEYIRPIYIDDYEKDLSPIIDQLIKIKKNNLSIRNDLTEKVNVPPKTESKEPALTNILISFPEPIDKEKKLNFDEIANCFSNFNVKLSFSYLNIDSLRQSVYEKYDYIFLFTQSVKGKILIEDEYLKSKYIDFEDLEENLAHGIKIIFIIYTGDNLNIKSLSKLKLPYIILNYTDKIKQIITDIIYKAFTKASLEILEQKCLIINKENAILNGLIKGNKFSIQKYSPNLSAYIDKKNLLNFVGRKTDIENIIRKIIEISYENRILTIKGAGGIGKTTVVTKAALELANRGFFNKGIHFIPCERISNYENFEFLISQCFNLGSSINLREQVIDNVNSKELLIILDNFETLLYLKENSEIRSLVSFLCDYSILIVTSRQKLDFDFEELYELRNFTAEEGLELFKKWYPYIKPHHEKTLRNDIIDKILNNNPLAIKLIAKGLPPSKDMDYLKDELNERLFQDEDIEKIFERQEDINIEKSNSLYHSINYSYQKLSEKEKLTFELLSLFPDGIHMENLKAFSKNTKSSKTQVTDTEIKSLDNKSLLENSNGFIKLQSIVGRFADHRFQFNEDAIKNDYYTQAFDYNNFMINLLQISKRIDEFTYLRILDSNSNNYLKSLEYLVNTKNSFEDKIIYISSISKAFIKTNQPKGFLERTELLKDHFESNELLLLNLIDVKVEYYSYDFEKSFERLQELMPIDKLKSLDLTKRVNIHIFLNTSLIYENEGYDYELFTFKINSQTYQEKVNLSNQASIFFKLGFLKEAEELSKSERDIGFFKYENYLALNKLDLNSLNDYIKGIYKKNNLELVQCTYIKAKVSYVSKKEIEALVVSNPFTEGLIFLMHALNEHDLEEKIKLIKKAIFKLYHIKYYYIEAIYHLANHLINSDITAFEEWYNKGIELARKYHYRYLIYRFEELKNRTGKQYDSNEYLLPDKLELAQYIKKIKLAKN